MDEKEGGRDVVDAKGQQRRVDAARSESLSDSSSSTTAPKAERSSSEKDVQRSRSFDEGKEELAVDNPDIDHDEAEAACPGHELDVELGHHHVSTYLTYLTYLPWPKAMCRAELT